MAKRAFFSAASVSLAVMVTLAVGERSTARAQSTSGQTPAAAAPVAASTLTVDARLVNVPVVVRDKRGALVQHLAKENFVLQVDGTAQTIRYFNIDTDLPLTLGLLVDTSMSQRNEIEDEQKASEAFGHYAGMGLTGTRLFVIQFAAIRN